MTVASTAVQLRLATAVWEQVDAAASEEGRSIGPVIGDAVRRALPDAGLLDPPLLDSAESVRRHVELDNDVLGQVAAVASRLGRSADQVIEDSVRRDLAARLLAPALADNDRMSPELSENAALELAYAELDAVRSGSETPRR